MSELQHGDRINNYIVEELIGTGSFGQVFKAKHHIFDEYVAIKIPTDPQYVQNLRREGVTVHGLRHDNIVRALDMDPYHAPPYLIMEYIAGPTLREVIDTNPKGLPQRSAVNIMKGVLAALAAAHQAGVIHRDLKPANILLTVTPSDASAILPQQVKVTDFGLGSVGGLTTASIMQSGSRHTAEGRSISGTLAYMSPEQRDGREIDPRSDLYACGVVLFEMLTGIRPQGNDLPSHIRSGAPQFLDDVFKRCYTRVENRFRNADEVLAALNRDTASSPAASASAIPKFGRSAGAPVCKNCGARVPGDDQFCIHCGNQLADQVPRCQSCAAFVYDSDNYCIMCGMELSKASSRV